jgi:hypothetical protein
MLDTNVIIEAHRTRCWNAVVKGFALETTKECADEAGRGDQSDPLYVAVQVSQMSQVVTVDPAWHEPVKARSVFFSLLQPGEQELLVYAYHDQSLPWASTADTAAVRAGHELGLLDRFVTLEELARLVGARPNLRRHFTNAWLSRLRTELKLESLS